MDGGGNNGTGSSFRPSGGATPRGRHAVPIPGLRPGLRFGDGFVLLRKLGAGAMSEVWLAREEALERAVALKILRGDEGDSDGYGERRRKRFLREAGILAACGHPSILPIYRSGVDPALSLPYYATRPCLLDESEMRHVCADILRCPFPCKPSDWGAEPRALPLADIVAGGKTLPETSVARIGKALVRAVAYAHSLPDPVIHRDIKPANILFEKDGKVLLTDFGIAKKIHRTGGPLTITTTDSRKRGVFIGTFAYSSPEQQKGAEPTKAVDYYAIAVVLYEALTGSRPRSLEKPSDFDPGHISRRWDALLKQMLLPDPGARLTDPAKIVAELEAIERAPRRRRAVWAATATAAAALAVGVFATARFGVPPASAAFTLPPCAPVGDPPPGTIRTVMLPDGVEMAFAWCYGPKTHYNRSARERASRPDAIGVNTVFITNGFWMARTELTVRQAQALFGQRDDLGGEAANRPALVSDASGLELYSMMANALGLLGKGEYFDFPTEAEWEYACLGGSPLPFGGQEPDAVCVSAENAGGTPWPVARKAPNGYGLYDMCGNAPEWCSDAFAPLPSGPLVSPRNPPSDSRDARVVKGGAWSTPADSCTPDARFRPEEFNHRAALRFVIRSGR